MTRERQTQEQKFEGIIENYINGNISDTKEQVRKLSKEKRKALYMHVVVYAYVPDKPDAMNFFFKLI